jgi:hypothetical protein
MYQKTTRETHDEYCNVMNEIRSSRSLNPRQETLALIMQFACAYHVEKKLPLRISEMMLN